VFATPARLEELRRSTAPLDYRADGERGDTANPAHTRDAVAVSGCSMASQCADRSQVVLEPVVGDAAPECTAVHDRRAVVHATPYPRVFDLLTHLRQAMIGARHFHRRIGQTEADLIPKELPQDPRRGTRVRGAPGRLAP
jgi:hypothetical protein